MPHSLPPSPHFPPLHLSSRDKAGSESKFPRFCHFAARSSSAKKFDPHTRHLGAVLLPHVAVRPAVRQYDQPASPAPRRRLAAVAAVGGARSGRGLDKDAVVASGRSGAVWRLHLRLHRRCKALRSNLKACALPPISVYGSGFGDVKSPLQRFEVLICRCQVHAFA